MKYSTDFNLLTENIDGLNLIEAGAGTGKTFTVSLLYLRFICEKRLSPKEIVAVTFTKAAASEMKGRIYEFVLIATDYIKTGNRNTCKNKLIANYIDLISKSIDKKILIANLEKALLTIDESVISTIHSFCMRLISEFSFETGSDFNVEPVTDTSDIQNTIAEDFWRSHIQNLTEIEYGLCKDIFRSSSELNRYLTGINSHPKIKIKGIPNSKVDIEYSYTNIIKSANRIYNIWTKENTEIEYAINNPDNGFYKKVFNSNFTVKNFPKIDLEIKNILTGKNLLTVKIDSLSLAKLSKKYIHGKSPKAIVEHRFFDEVDLFFSKLENFRTNSEIFKRWIIGQYIEYFTKRYPHIKNYKNIVDYNDLIRNVSFVVANNQNISSLISTRYKVAFVDEFQDTDEEQFTIFQKIFSFNNSSLFLVGDPKQAIYRFRGGDVYAYLNAVRDERIKKFTLTKNYRSSKAIIKSLNSIFTSTKAPFLNEDIKFHPAEIGNSEIPTIPEEKPVTVFVNKSSKKSNSKNSAINATVSSINKLLSEKVLLGKTPITPSDIAILVKSNGDAQIFKYALNKISIPATTFRSGSVFESDEYFALLRIMASIINISDLGLLKATLHMYPFGISSEEINNSTYEYLNIFYKYRTTWKEKGFVSMIYALFEDNNIVSSLFGKGIQSERSVVNFRQLLEIISSLEENQKNSPILLYKNFYKLKGCQDEAIAPERLESDSQAVKVITIHSSKGLEFPVVFIPFSWQLNKSNNKKANTILYHNQENQLILDIDTTTHFDIFQKETDEELRRLLYVALTRASSKIYMSHIQEDSNSFPEEKLYKDNPDLFEIVEIDDSSEDIKVGDSKTSYSKIKVLELESTPFGRITKSYSSLAISDHIPLRRSDYKTDSIIHFPPGPTTGSAWHRIFELAEFNNPNTYSTAVTAGMREFGFSEHYYSQKTIEDMVSTVLNKNFKSNFAHICLKKLTKDSYKTELEFLLNTPHVDTNEIEETIRNTININTPMVQNNFKGFIKGFMDLVFLFEGRYYILDWKSNYLGDSLSDYTQENIDNAMVTNNYHLQYILYTVALAKILGTSNNIFNYGEEFGGVFYIFLRGVNTQNNNGIFYTLPDMKLISKLVKYFS